MPAADHLIDQYGYDIARAVLSTDAIASLCQALKSLDHDGVRRRGGNAYAARNLLTYCDEVRERSCSDPLLGLARSTIGEGARPVKATLFDKMPDANWAIRWHQDQVIAVRVRIEVDGFGPWSIKAGVPHVRAPAAVLERMVALRIHLDDCDADNGCLQVIPSSHRAGQLSPEDAAAWRAVCGGGLRRPCRRRGAVETVDIAPVIPGDAAGASPCRACRVCR